MRVARHRGGGGIMASATAAVGNDGTRASEQKCYGGVICKDGRSGEEEVAATGGGDDGGGGDVVALAATRADVGRRDESGQCAAHLLLLR